MCHECLLPTWIKSCGTFLRLAVVRLDLNNMCRHAAFYELEVVKFGKAVTSEPDNAATDHSSHRYLETGI